MKDEKPNPEDNFPEDEHLCGLSTLEVVIHEKDMKEDIMKSKRVMSLIQTIYQTDASPRKSMVPVIHSSRT